MTDMSDAVESLKRAVATPGDFETYYPNTSDDDLVGSLEDAFAQCQLDGFFTVGYTLDLNTDTVTPDLTPAQIALIILYSSVRIIQNQLMNTKNVTKYAANGLTAEVQTSSNILTSLLALRTAEKTDIFNRLTTVSTAAAMQVVDWYFIKGTAIEFPYTYGTALGAGPEIDWSFDNIFPYGYGY